MKNLKLIFCLLSGLLFITCGVKVPQVNTTANTSRNTTVNTTNKNTSQPETASSLYTKGMAAYESKNFLEAGDILQKSLNLRAHPTVAYNAACSYALAKQSDKAFKMLDVALDLGVFAFEQDADFDNIKNDARFKTIVAKGKNHLEMLKQNSPTEPVITKPQNYDASKKYGLLVLIHGYGGSPQNFTDFHTALSEKYNLITIASRGSEVNGKDKYFWNYSDEEIARIISEIKAVMANNNIDKNKVFLSGFSQGGYLTMKVGFEHSNLFNGIIPVAGNFNADKIDVENASNKALKVFTIVGNEDRKTLVANNEVLKQKCDANGIKMKNNVFDIGHTYPENKDEVLMQAMDWFLKN